MTPFSIACKYGYDDIALQILNRTNIENIISVPNDCLPLHFICKFKEEKLELVKSIMNKLNSQKRLSNILTACYYNNEIINEDENFNIYVNEAIKLLDNNGETIFSYLIENNHLNIIEFILKEFNQYVVDLIDKNNNYVIHLAAKSGTADILKLLVKYNLFSAKTNSNGENALHIAAANNKFNFIKDYLICEKNIMNKEASEKDNKVDDNIAKISLASVNCLNKNGQTPLFVAINAGNLKCVEALTNSNDLDLTLTDSKGNSIYHVCLNYIILY
jgi:ankyrin repeat protein